MSGNEASADSLYALQMQKILDLCKQTYLEHTDDIVGLQAFSMLIEDLEPEELDALLQLGAPFIREDETIAAMMEARKEEAEGE